MSLQYGFFPYSRRAAAASIAAGQADSTGRSQATVRLRIESGTEAPAAEHEQRFTVLGPGDVVGIDAAQVVRTVPRPDTHNMEPNYLVQVEFAHPDFPWLFTPEPPDAQHHLRPWIALVVLEESDARGPGAERRERRRVMPRPGIRVPVLTAEASELPDLDEAWAWAHVQVLDDGTPAADVLAHWETRRDRVVSRLLSPRHLAPDRSWVACVVPTYRSGVQAGFGEVPNAGSDPAWRSNSGTVTLPVYYYWRFATGPAGDFETLAQKLRGAKQDEIGAVGYRRVHLHPVLSRLTEDEAAFAPTRLDVPTAIAHHSIPGPLSPLATTTPLEATRTAVGRRLKFLVDLPERVRRAGAEALVVGPPMYGQWHAERRSLDDRIDDPTPTMPATTAWLTELNADVEQRTVAALGTRVVQRDQEELMARAWEQLQAVADANRRARWGLVFQSSMMRAHARRLEGRSTATLLRLASPALGRLGSAAGGATVAARIRASAMPLTVAGASFSRATRFVTRAAAIGAPSGRVLEALVAPMLESRLTAASATRFAPAARLDADRFQELLAPRVAGQPAPPVDPAIAEQIQAIRELPATIREAARRLEAAAQPPEQPPGQPTLEPDAPRMGGGLRRAIDRAGARFEQASSGPAAQRQHLERLDTAAQEQRADLAVQTPAHGQPRVVERFLALRPASAPAAAAVARFAEVRSATLTQLHLVDPSATVTAVSGLAQDALERVAAALDRVPSRITSPEEQAAALPQPVAVDPEETKRAVLTHLEPAAQYERMLKWALPLPERGPQAVAHGPRRRSPSHEIIASPHFTDPVLERVRRLDAEWVLGHADRLPPNSISFFVANARFAESLLVGANYEIARELQWRRYPTDSMGTCFARFWPLPPDAPDDIAPIPEWDDKLGENSADGDRHPGEDVVIVVRGDLLRRYPNTIVSAVRGQVRQDADGQKFVPDPHAQVVRELFRGFLGPDLTYAGLAVSVDTLKSPTSGDGNRWYIALTQPVDEPRFGLDDDENASPPPSNSLNELSWQSLRDVVTNDMLRVSRAVGGDLSGEAGESTVRWGPSSHAGHIASILFQLPFQLLLPASDYL